MVKYLSLAEVKEILEKEGKKRELSYEQKLAYQHAQQHARIDSNDVHNLIKELRKYEQLPDAKIYKIADLMPTTVEELKCIFGKERIVLGENEINEIIEKVKKYI
ncbi:MAG: RNA polymerase Rpb4 family protein [Candidatus Thermoplasmatota archaeon]